MQVFNSSERYGLVSLALHWLTVAFVILVWSLGQGGDLLPKGAPRDAGLFIHMSSGLAIVVLVAARLAWRVFDPPPPPEPTPFGYIGEISARLGHFALYALLVLAPVLGILTQFARGNPLPIFGLMNIASPWVADRTFARSVTGIHELLSNALVIVALLHAFAALAHHWLLRDRTLSRMMPGK
ncbi:MAG: cytochrome b [Xanthobacteraceae bacterium]